MIRLSYRIPVFMMLGAAALSCAAPSAVAGEIQCTGGWKVTGYYTPVESDFADSRMRSVHLHGTGVMRFPADFLDAIAVQGWGKTRQGWYLGLVDHQWRRSARALNASGRVIQIGDVATDPGLLPAGSRLTIRALPAPWNQMTLRAHDTGAAVNGKVIDVYFGEGSAAESLSYQYAGAHRRVCMPAQQTARAEDDQPDLVR